MPHASMHASNHRSNPLTGSDMPNAGKRIGLIAETHGEGVDTAVRDAVEACAAHLSSLGATVEEVQPFKASYHAAICYLPCSC
jgi:Asp-tRNA(Asn)/Glu-tRNA(Gln) amidotransferase A subunit family amidase